MAFFVDTSDGNYTFLITKPARRQKVMYILIQHLILCICSTQILYKLTYVLQGDIEPVESSSLCLNNRVERKRELAGYTMQLKTDC